ncbi:MULTISPECIES: GNAT family N-acetyltransferase [Methylobacterium]|uniref:N-acetyltransferase family protein n=1 Tax=Methylobacterium longum TaxID=767694 RepID=A0ABT8AJW3_9HYPH|nr:MULTISPECIES: GNAT family N-acetyltransferase [Methylobacterium]MCJ2101487.1 GNAT family N-acetyltransferase [Methylobacterium sp. E-046]MDN3569684.1 N-acetyltransferase family protein [Methylobacterium longum]
MTDMIRPAREADLPAITAIYGDAVATSTVSFETEAPTLAEMTRRFALLRGDGFPYLVAERDGAIAGYAYAGPYHQRAAYRSTVEDSIYVARAFRGRGVGRSLLAALIAASEHLDCRAMIAIIAQSGSQASVVLHASLGFTPVGTLVGVGYKHGRWLDVTLMQRPLGAARDAPPTRI